MTRKEIKRHDQNKAFTPGPWTFEYCGGNWYVFGSDDAILADTESEDGWTPADTVARMRGAERGRSDAEKQANAMLIAAAPALYAALIRMFDEPYGCRFCDSGTLRTPGNPEKDHEDHCAFKCAMAALIQAGMR